MCLEGASPTYPTDVKPGRPLFSCTLCPGHEPFIQKQVLMRHQREQHQTRSECWSPDCDYKWTRSRSSEYRRHLRKRHRLKDDNINEILGGPPRHRRFRGRVTKSDLPPHPLPSPISPIEHGRQSLAEPQQRPPLLAVGKDAHHASSPLVPSVAYNPRHWHDAELEFPTIGHEDSIGLEHLAATHAPSRLLSEEEFALLVRYFDRSCRFRFRVAHAFYMRHI